LIDIINNNEILSPDLPPNNFARFSNDISICPPVILAKLNGIFLGIMELIAKFDQFLKE
jgi:hypothetical protein